MVAAFFFMELNLNGLSCDLIEGHVKGTLPRDEYALGDDILILIGFGYFEHEWYFFGELMVFHEYG